MYDTTREKQMPSKPLAPAHRLAIITAITGGAGPSVDAERLVLANMLMFARVHTTDDGEPAGIQYRGGARRLAQPFQEVSKRTLAESAYRHVDELLEALARGGYVTLLRESVPSVNARRQGEAAHWKINL